jgi:YaiO family outer membrane protein
MKKLTFLILLSSVVAHQAKAEPLSVDAMIAKSMALAESKQYDAAIDLLHEAEKREPENADPLIAEARISSWQGRYDRADSILKPIIVKDPGNTDALTAEAYVDYYRNHLDAAAASFSTVLAAHPDDTEASDGLKLVHAAQESGEGFQWIFDAGYEHSTFARQSQQNWSNEFVQITRLFDHGETAVHARYEHYDEFLTTDSYYEIGIDHSFEPYLTGYLYAGHTLDASFHPTWKTSAGGTVRMNTPDGLNPVLWLTLDAREEDYSQADFLDVNPGIRVEYMDWALSPNLVAVRQWGSQPVFGFNARIDTPNWDGFHFYAGYADAPDTENAVTVYTATIYGGASYDVTDALTLRLGYAHDDRADSYIRHVIDASLTYRY